MIFTPTNKGRSEFLQNWSIHCGRDHHGMTRRKSTSGRERACNSHCRDLTSILEISAHHPKKFCIFHRKSQHCHACGDTGDQILDRFDEERMPHLKQLALCEKGFASQHLSSPLTFWSMLFWPMFFSWLQLSWWVFFCSWRFPLPSF